MDAVMQRLHANALRARTLVHSDCMWLSRCLYWGAAPTTLRMAIDEVAEHWAAAHEWDGKAIWN